MLVQEAGVRADALTSALYCHQLVSGFSHQLNVE